MAIVVMAGVLGNSMIFIVICWNKSLKRSVNIFLLNLAIADVGMVSTCMPYAIGAIVSKDQVGPFCIKPRQDFILGTTVFYKYYLSQLLHVH